jgi:ribonuclease HI
MRVVAAVDGSCIGNPGPGGWAWVTADGQEGSAAARQTTNNRMELRAVLELLKAVPSQDDLLVQSDSAYVIGVFTQWLPNWRENGFRTAARKPVDNQDLIEEIDQHLGGRVVEWEKVPGHAGHLLNERADALANSAARRAVARVAQEKGTAGS